MSPALQAVVGLAFTGWGAFGIAILVANEWRRRYYVERARADEMQQRASRWMTRAVRAEGDAGHFAYRLESDGSGVYSTSGHESAPRAGVDA